MFYSIESVEVHTRHEQCWIYFNHFTPSKICIWGLSVYSYFPKTIRRSFTSLISEYIQYTLPYLYMYFMYIHHQDVSQISSGIIPFRHVSTNCNFTLIIFYISLRSLLDGGNDATSTLNTSCNQNISGISYMKNC